MVLRELLVGIVGHDSSSDIVMSINIALGFWVIIGLFVWMALEVIILYLSNKELVLSPFKEGDDITPESRVYNVRALTLSGLTFAGIALLIDAFSQNILEALDVIIILVYGFGLFLCSYRIELLTNYRRVYWILQEKLLNFGFLALVFSLVVFFYVEKINVVLYLVLVFAILIIVIHLIEFKTDYEYYSSRHD